jgi:hypothetical protein
MPVYIVLRSTLKLTSHLWPGLPRNLTILNRQNTYTAFITELHKHNHKDDCEL